MTYTWNIGGTSTTTTTNTITTPALTTTTTYTVQVTNANNYTGPVSDIGTITVYPNFSAGSITTNTITTPAGKDPDVTIGNSSVASGGNGSITYQWRRSGTSSATLTGSASTYSIGSQSANYSTAGTYYFRRYAHDGLCNTSWVASTGTYTLTVTDWKSCGITDVSNNQSEGSEMNWSAANSLCNNKDGGSGWRLPTVSELQCMCENKESLPGGGVSGHGAYWSSTAAGSDTHHTVYFLSNCLVSSNYDVSNRDYVKCVKK
jgi:hypothetical protein